MAPAAAQAGLVDVFVELRGDLCPHARGEADAEAVLFDQLAQARQQGAGEVRLGAGAAHGVGEERRLPLLVRRQLAQKVVDLPPRLLAEDPLAVEPHQPAREVAAQRRLRLAVGLDAEGRGNPVYSMCSRRTP